MTIYPIILCGGSGTRLWPLSREFFPKPFLNLMGESSLLQDTILRLNGLDDVTNPYVVCNEEHRFLVSEQARQIGYELSSVILEPEGRNTAPALTLVASLLTNGYRDTDVDDPVMLIMPADHVIKDSEAFRANVQVGADIAEMGAVVTFGIVPDSPKTSYGYIRKGPVSNVLGSSSDNGASENGSPCDVSAFVEKPDEATAKGMIDSGEYLWNSGIFMMKASVWLEELRKFRPDIAESCERAHSGGEADGGFFRPEEEAFLNCPSDSIDYAVMEHLGGRPGRNGTGCIVLPLDVGWSDIGAWSALWEESDQDPDGNVIEGDVYTQSIKNSLILGQHRLVTAVGLENVIIVETPDAVLVADKDHVQDVRDLVTRLKEDGREEGENHRKVHRPWGTYEVVDGGSRFQVKRLTVNPGCALSLQMHHHRAEHWVVVKGTANVTRGDEQFLLIENQSAYVPVGVQHRLENPGTIPLEIIEVQSGGYLGEDDIVRFEDRYNRHKGR